MGIIGTLDDRCWDLLEVLHLGAFFDKHHIPPLMFPISLIVFVLLAFALSSSPSPQPICGNDVCEPEENATSCPADCVPSEHQELKTIKVRVTGGLRCERISVVIKGRDNSVLDSKTNQKNRVVIFQSISTGQIKAVVSSPESTKAPVSSNFIDTSREDTISISLPDDYCDEKTKKGSIRVLVRDKSTGESMAAHVTLFDSGGTKRGSRDISGEDVFSKLDANTYYYLTATASGYYDYYGGDERILVEPEKEKTRTIYMEPVPSLPENQTGKIEVCVRNEEGPIEDAGQIGLYDMEDNLFKVGSLSDCPLFRGMASGAGCYIFTVPAGKEVYVGMAVTPGGCATPGKSGPYTIEADRTEHAYINLTCNLTGTMRVVVYGNNSQVLTSNCTIELYGDDGGKIKTLNTSADGLYTEWVSLREGEYTVYAKNVPHGYLETQSNVEIERGDNKTVAIQLNIKPPPLPNLTIYGARVSQQVLQKGENFTLTADSVRLRGEVLTDANVSVICESEWGETKRAVYKGFWECNLTAPDSLGEMAVSIRAEKEGANSDFRAFTVYVINESEQALHISWDAYNSLTMGPSVVLYFNITRAGGEVEVPRLDEADLSIYHLSDGVKRFIGNFTLSRVRDGYFRSSFSVPFSGDYLYELRAGVVINATLYWGLDQYGFFVQNGAPGAVSCQVDPEIAGPGDLVHVYSLFTFLGSPLPEQDMAVFVIGNRTSSYPLIWNSTTEMYEAEIPADSDECAHTINCSSLDDPDLYSTTTLYVVNPNPPSVDPSSCPSNSYLCLNLSDARNCYKRFVITPTKQYYDEALSCARRCTDSGSCVCGESQRILSECHQPVSFAVSCMDGGLPASTGKMYFWLGGTASGEEQSISYPPPGDNLTSCSLVDVAVPGLREQGPTTRVVGDTVILTIDNSGHITATAICRVQCGVKGDLDNDGTPFTDKDLRIMNSLIDAISLLGPLPYDQSIMQCADINNDSVLTEHDYLCMDAIVSGGEVSELCKSCREQLGSAYSDIEVCNDGLDNNCDGQVDEDTYGSDGLYGSLPTPMDLCSCYSDTPCEMLWDITGLSPVSSESDVLRCAEISYIGPSYRWNSLTERACTKSRADATLKCNGQTYTCTNRSGEWRWENWYNWDETYPPNEL